jgi:hypothetical protein
MREFIRHAKSLDPIITDILNDWSKTYNIKLGDMRLKDGAWSWGREHQYNGSAFTGGTPLYIAVKNWDLLGGYYLFLMDQYTRAPFGSIGQLERAIERNTGWRVNPDPDWTRL